MECCLSARCGERGCRSRRGCSKYWFAPWLQRSNRTPRLLSERLSSLPSSRPYRGLVDAFRASVAPPRRTALLNLLDTIASDAAIFGGLVNYASVSCQVQAIYSPCPPYSQWGALREKPRRGLPPRRGFSLVARQSPFGGAALIHPLHTLPSEIPQGSQDGPDQVRQRGLVGPPLLAVTKTPSAISRAVSGSVAVLSTSTARRYS